MPTTYRYTLYHDDGIDAAVDTKGSPLPGFASAARAVKAAQASITDYWQTASVEKGRFVPGVLGEYPDDWEMDIDWHPIIVTREYVDDPRTYR